MKPHFLFPASPLNGRMIDESFQDQAVALKMAGFGTSVLTDDMKIIGPVPQDATVIYRGWMMDTDGYQDYLAKLNARPLTPLTSLEQYLATHHLPNWYPLIERMTPETRFMGGLEFYDGIPVQAICAEINAIGFQRIFVKDFVKSLKTKERPDLDCPIKAEDLRRVIEAMIKYRGKIEGGLAVREFEDFKPDSEKRYFVINGRFYGQEVLFDTRVMELLIRVAGRIPSPFYSVDIAERTDGHFRVVELGDGQVSDLIGWTAGRFAQVWKEAL